METIFMKTTKETKDDGCFGENNLKVSHGHMFLNTCRSYCYALNAIVSTVLRFPDL